MAKSAKPQATIIEQPEPQDAAVETPAASEQPEPRQASVELQHTTTVVSVQAISSSASENLEDHRLVTVVAAYTDSYKGARPLEEGKQYKMAPETADLLVQKGMAKLVD